MYARHDLVWLGEAGWDGAVATADSQARAALADWRAAGWPAVVRRADADAPPGQVALGIPLPPRAADGRKLRIPIRVPADAVLRHEAPLALARTLVQALPPGWQHALAELDQQARACGLTLRVYGSTALQALTGQAYLRAGSDVDLLLHPCSRIELARGSALLHCFAARLPLDGEIVFPGGRAVAWKEWLGALGGAPGTRVLVKEMSGVRLMPTDALFAALEEEACLP